MLVTKCYLLLCINYSVKLYVHALCYYYVVISILMLISDTGIQKWISKKDVAIESYCSVYAICCMAGRSIHCIL